MQKYGICVICEKNLAKHRCGICGRLVCDDDYVYAGEICRECKIGKI